MGTAIEYTVTQVYPSLHIAHALERHQSRIWNFSSAGAKLDIVFLSDFADTVEACQTLPIHGSPLFGLDNAITAPAYNPILDPRGNPYLFLDAEDVRVEPNGKHCEITLSYKQYYDPSMTHYYETWSFDCMAKSEKETTVPNAWYKVDYPDTADKGLAINVRDGKVEGVDALRPRMTAHCKKFYHFLTQGGLDYISSMQGTINGAHFLGALDPFWITSGISPITPASIGYLDPLWAGSFGIGAPGYQPGQILLEGATISDTPNRDMVQVDYTFQIGNMNCSFWQQMLDGTSLYITVPTPWDYVWYTFGKIVAGAGTEADPKKLKYGVLDVHVNRIYEMADWSGLGLAGPFAPRMWPGWTP